MHIDDLRVFAMLWLHKTEEVRADTAHYSRNISGDIYESGWISEMYGYSFGAAEVCHLIFFFISAFQTLGQRNHAKLMGQLRLQKIVQYSCFIFQEYMKNYMNVSLEL